MRRTLPITFVILSVLLEPQAAHAYLDPGTGSMLLSVFVGLISGVYFVIRKLPSTLRSLFFRLTGKTDALKHSTLTFYAESAAYWTTFRPILVALEKLGVQSSYLTSDEKDPVFASGLKCVHPRFIGKSNTAYTALGFLQTKVLVLTTPGIDVLQIRRSPGVGRYVHVVHAVGDIHTYKLFSFDYYDAVYCAGPGQVKSLRALEALRGTRPKELPQLGCPYLDGLVERARKAASPEEGTVIVAPTWGRNGLLTRTGAVIPKMLAQAGFRVILRPHPQSFVSEPELMEQLAQELSPFDNVQWDRHPDGFASLSRAQLMVSDISGVIFDFAFVFLRPVVSVGAGPLKDGFEAWEIPHEAWEMSALDTLGKRILPGEENSVVDAVRSLLASEDRAREKILSLREQNVVNFGEAGMPIAKALVAEVERLKTQSTRKAQTKKEP
jgi:CDP-glycerol:poly(glycerophosphate) glycerophosphotransferase